MSDFDDQKTVKTSARELFWPIYGKEHKIWFPMATLVGLILFNYTVARNLKDSLVVTATGSSEIIPYLKGTLVLPASIIFFFFYAKLANWIGKRSLFYVIITLFLAVFILFALVLYPNHEILHPSESADILQRLLPRGLKGLADCYRVWTFSVFYVASELWGVAAAQLLFWQFANDVIKVSDAKRFYAHLYLLANVFVAISGVIVAKLSKGSLGLEEGVDYWGIAITKLTFVMTICGLLILAVYFYLDRFVFTKKYLESQNRSDYQSNEKLQMSVTEGLKHLFRSKYLGLMAMLLICYGITANLLEITWKRQLGLVFITGNEYAAFMGHLSTATGIGTIISIFLGSILIRKLGWRIAALTTPFSVGLTGTIFFLAVIFPDYLAIIGSPLGVSPLLVAVIIGFGLEVLIKSIKYALFDPTKEMAYIPLDDESKIRGKAAVDVVAGRFGKSSGGFFEIAILAVIGSMSGAVPYFAGFFIFFTLAWIFAANSLSKKFQAACLKQEMR